MAKRTFSADGAVWTVSVIAAGAAPGRDELPLLFEGAAPDGRRVRRVSRCSPVGIGRWSSVLENLTDARLAALLRQSQPAWTSPELGYSRGR